MEIKKEHHYALVALGIAALVILAWVLILSRIQQSLTLQQPTPRASHSVVVTAMHITSSVFSQNERIPSPYTCQGENVNPPLVVDGVPSRAKSIAFIMDDPDAPSGVWTHWLWWNASASLHYIPQNSIPAGVTQGTTSAGTIGYHGPCPPSGTHRYIFHIYALDVLISLPSSAGADALRTAMEGHILAQGQLIGLYAK